MADPTLIVGGSAVAAYLSRDGFNKLLGPTADYLGDSLKELVEKKHQNLSEIFRRAHTKLGSKIENPGTVRPRVLKSVLEDGSFTEDSLAAASRVG